MLERLKAMLKTPFTMLPIVAVLIVFTSGIASYFTVDENQKNVEIVERIERQQSNREWKTIESIISYNMDMYRQNSRLIGLQLEHDLRNSYPDLRILEEQMDNDSYDRKFYDILKKNLHDGQYNKAVTKPYLKMVGTEEHIVAFYSNSREHTMTPIEDDREIGDESSVLWATVPDYNFNPTLSEKAIQAAIRDRKRALIFTQTSASSSGKVEQMKDMTMEELRHLYKEEGLEEFRHINLLAPAYITEDGDIFGNEDTTKGFKKNKTKKIIVIQSVNLYDLLERHRAGIDDEMSGLNRTMVYVQQYNQQRVLTSILLSFILWSVAVFLIFVYNTETRNREQHSDDK